MDRRATHLRFEHLETRRLLTTFLVDSILDNVDPDDGVLSFREAVLASNESSLEADEIRFAESTRGRIKLKNGPLLISDSVAIYGPGADLLTIDAAGNDPTPEVDDGLGSSVFRTSLSGDFDNHSVLEIVGLTLTGGDTFGDFTNGGGAISIGNFAYVDLIVRDSVIRDNYSDHRGGAIWANAQFNRITIENVWIDGNRSFDDGGGIFSRGPVTVINSTLSNNSTTNGEGGAIARRNLVTVVGSTISGNHASREGGAMYLSGFGYPVVIRHSTIANNTSNTSIAGLETTGMRTTNLVIENSILANGANGANLKLLGNANPLRNSVLDSNEATRIRPTDGGPDEFGNLVGSSFVPLEVGMDPLGPLPGVLAPIHALAEHSVAVNLGNSDFQSGSLLADQTGRPRLSGGRLDAGAFEYQTPIIGLDLSGDGEIGCQDVDLLVASVSRSESLVAYDLTNDGIVDDLDLQNWLTNAGIEKNGQPLSLADANLDGFVNSQDLDVWSDNRFTDEFSWCRGNFNADNTVDGADFNVWLEHRSSISEATDAGRSSDELRTPARRMPHATYARRSRTRT